MFTAHLKETYEFPSLGRRKCPSLKLRASLVEPYTVHRILWQISFLQKKSIEDSIRPSDCSSLNGLWKEHPIFADWEVLPGASCFVADAILCTDLEAQCWSDVCVHPYQHRWNFYENVNLVTLVYFLGVFVRGGAGFYYGRACAVSKRI